MLEPLVEQLLSNILLVIASLLGLFLAGASRIAMAFLKVKLGEAKYAFLRAGAKTIVRFLEQSHLWDAALAEGSKKKEAALLLLAAWADEHGLPADYELLDKVIEEAVNIMKSEVGSVWVEE